MYCKSLRMKRLYDPSKKICVVPMDHGITLGPINGLKDYITTINQVIAGGADAIVLHKGLMMKAIQQTNPSSCKFILHLSASTVLGTDSNLKTLVSSVEEAVMMGVDGVSMHVNLGCPDESKMIHDMGKVSADCQKWGMPLLAMMYAECQDKQSFEKTIHAARLAEELGADFVKIDCSTVIDNLDKLLEGVHIPVLIAGGPHNIEIRELLENINKALEMGVSGVAVGRNIFQHTNPKLITEVISRMVHGELLLSDALYKLKQNNFQLENV